MGQAPPGDSYNDTGEGVPLIAGAGDFGNGRLAPKKFTTAGTKFSSAGDIVLSIRASIGDKVWADGSYCLGRGVAGLRAGSQLEPRYLWHWLGAVEPELLSKARGATFLQVNRTDIAELVIALPELDEQRRIASILDKADTLRAKRREALARLDTLSQSIFHEMFGDPLANARGWEIASLPDVAKLYSGGTPSKDVKEYWNGSLPWFSPKDLKADHLTDSIDHISNEVLSQTSLRLLPEGTVVFVVRGMILAHSFPVSLLQVPATINQDLKAVLPKVELDPYFLLANLKSQKSSVLAHVATAAHGTKRLDAEALAMIRVLLPPVELQQQFAGRVAAVERLKGKHRAQLADLDMLFAALQDKAFKGELS
ncbi:restriction endonuclease subunit S [Arthrobacter sp. I2-34]|uniref:Restriction endonuclease subunit S n=2 Tax=Arthrobacter hankyongi TaxID=2904801 RepID=A0ABS9LE07_9MICC|nr:restriction endonuclease subunit S [Arthrobacter hankyongi]